MFMFTESSVNVLVATIQLDAGFFVVYTTHLLVADMDLYNKMDKLIFLFAEKIVLIINGQYK